MTNKELDIWIADNIMCWKKILIDNKLYADEPFEIYEMPEGHRTTAEHWNPTKFIHQAWKVVEKMKKLGYEVDITDCGDTYGIGFGESEIFVDSHGHSERKYYGDVFEKSAQLAICLAAKKAIENEQ